MSADIFASLTGFIKDRIINSVDQRISIWPTTRIEVYRPLEVKPRIRKLTNGRWINTNTCKYWSAEDEWRIAIHWCDLENSTSINPNE